MLKNKNEIISVRESVRGHLFDSDQMGEYAKNAVGGAAAGAVMGGGVAGAGAGALWGLGGKAVQDIWYATRKVEEKISWLAGDVMDIIQTQIATKLPNEALAEQLSIYANDYKNFIDHYIRDKKTTPLTENSTIGTSTPASASTPTQIDTNSIPPEVAQFATARTESKFVKISSSAPPISNTRQALNLPVFLKGLGADWLAQKGYDYASEKFMGRSKTEVISDAIEKCIAVIREIDNLAVSLSPELQAQIRRGGTQIYQLLNQAKLSM